MAEAYDAQQSSTDAVSRQTAVDIELPGHPIEELATTAAAAAQTIYREGRDFLAQNEEVSRAAGELSRAVRRNPLTAVGMAFAAGLVVARLMKG